MIIFGLKLVRICCFILGSLKENQCRKLKLNVNDTKVIKYFMCPMFAYGGDCSKVYSNFDTSSCSCGRLMTEEIQLVEEELGVFASGSASFIITNDFKVALNSTGLILKTLKCLGCADVSKLGEMLLDVGSVEVLTLLYCLLTSDSPLTDAFLRKKRLHGMTRMQIKLYPDARENRDEAEPLKSKFFSAGGFSGVSVSFLCFLQTPCEHASVSNALAAVEFAIRESSDRNAP